MPIAGGFFRNVPENIRKSLVARDHIVEIAIVLHAVRCGPVDLFVPDINHDMSRQIQGVHLFDHGVEVIEETQV